ncbi:hypothetical protein, partial [Bacteroides stercoris]|uniref:hypothetical protein n=1 Tax=Bacteroides stercoris TaxID=46506 RepID=UPI0035615DE7
KGHYTYPMVAQFSTGILAHFSISIYKHDRFGTGISISYMLWLVFCHDCARLGEKKYRSEARMIFFRPTGPKGCLALSKAKDYLCR